MVGYSATVRFVGEAHFAPGEWIGVELEPGQPALSCAMSWELCFERALTGKQRFAVSRRVLAVFGLPLRPPVLISASRRQERRRSSEQKAQSEAWSCLWSCWCRPFNPFQPFEVLHLRAQSRPLCPSECGAGVPSQWAGKFVQSVTSKFVYDLLLSRLVMLESAV